MDLTSRLHQFERALEQWHAVLSRADGDGGTPGSANTRVAATLTRIERLAEMLQSRINRTSDIDALDKVTMQLLLDDYSEVVRQLRATAADAAERLKSVSAVIADGNRLIRKKVRTTYEQRS